MFSIYSNPILIFQKAIRCNGNIKVLIRETLKDVEMFIQSLIHLKIIMEFFVNKFLGRRCVL